MGPEAGNQVDRDFMHILCTAYKKRKDFFLLASIHLIQQIENFRDNCASSLNLRRFPKLF